MSSFEVIAAGVLSLLQDNGRFGQSALGLTTGGAMDAPSARWANRLLGNHSNATLIECSVGGLQLRADCSSYIAVTGAELPLSINGKTAELWTVHKVQPGDVIELGMVNQGLRAYLAVAGGFAVTPQFGSVSTVLREGIGGLKGNKLQSGDVLAAQPVNQLPRLSLPLAYRPLVLDQLRSMGGTRFVVSLNDRPLDMQVLPVTPRKQAVIETARLSSAPLSPDQMAAAFEQAWQPALPQLTGLLREGKHLVIHCKGGSGRTGLVAAALLISLGQPQQEAMAAIKADRV